MCLRARSGPRDAFFLVSRLKDAHGGRFAHSAGRKNRRLFARERGRLDDASGGAAQLDGVDAAKLGRDLAPGRLRPPLGDSDEQEGEPAQQDVRADAVFEAVEDRPQKERRLQVPKAAFPCLSGLRETPAVADHPTRARQEHVEP